MWVSKSSLQVTHLASTCFTLATNSHDSGATGAAQQDSNTPVFKQTESPQICHKNTQNQPGEEHETTSVLIVSTPCWNILHLWVLGYFLNEDCMGRVRGGVYSRTFSYDFPHMKFTLPAFFMASGWSDTHWEREREITLIKACWILRALWH